MPAGRPTKYKKAFCKELIKHMKQGLSYETFPAVIGVSTQTLYDWEKRHPEYLEAKRTAWVEYQLFWEKMGVHGTAGKLKGFNSTSYIYNVKCRFRKSDTFGHDPDMEQRNTFNFNLSYDPKALKEGDQ